MNSNDQIQLILSILCKKMKLLNPLLQVEHTDRNFFEIIGWWELRRILYTLIEMVCGFLIFLIISSLINLKPSEDLKEPITIIGFLVFCNIGYTLGWMTEMRNKKSKSYGPNMFKLALFYSVLGFSTSSIACSVLDWRYV